jgi:hypothetical protein
MAGLDDTKPGMLRQGRQQQCLFPVTTTLPPIRLGSWRIDTALTAMPVSGLRVMATPGSSQAQPTRMGIGEPGQHILNSALRHAPGCWLLPSGKNSVI